MIRQFTSTVYIVENEQVLLIYHKKLGKWLPPGGHLHQDELPHEGAIREAFEETGLRIEIFMQENIWMERWNACSIPRPYLCLLEEIPSFGDQPSHQHIDMIYVAKPVDGTLTHNHEETHAVKWFNLEQVRALQDDVEIFIETKQTIEHLLSFAFKTAI